MSRMLLPQSQRQQISDAIHAVIAARPDCDQGRGMCHLFALAGARVTNALLGEERYHPIFGTLLFDPGWGWEAVIEHAWFVAENGGRFEVVDLAARHWPYYTAGRGYVSPPAPPYVWAWSSQLEQSSLPWRPFADLDGAAELVRLARTRGVKRLVRDIVQEALEELTG